MPEQRLARTRAAYTPAIEILELRCPGCERVLRRPPLTLDPTVSTCECGWSGRTVFYRAQVLPLVKDPS